MKYRYKTKGTCSTEINIEMSGDTIVKVAYTGGCNGNLQGICKLVEGQKAQYIIDKFKNIHCGYKDTSCPDQLARALEELICKDKKENNDGI